MRTRFTLYTLTIALTIFFASLAHAGKEQQKDLTKIEKLASIVAYTTKMEFLNYQFKDKYDLYFDTENASINFYISFLKPHSLDTHRTVALRITNDMHLLLKSIGYKVAPDEKIKRIVCYPFTRLVINNLECNQCLSYGHAEITNDRSKAIWRNNESTINTAKSLSFADNR